MTGVMDDLLTEMRKHWKPTFIIILIPLAYLSTGAMGKMSFPTSWFFLFLMATGLVVGDAMWKAWRYDTRHLQAPNIHASYDQYYDEGEHRICPIGSIKHTVGCYQGGEGTVIAPRRFFREWKDKGGMMLYARPQMVEREMLPEDVQKIIGNPHYDGVKAPFFYTETPVIPMSLLDITDTIMKKVMGILPDPVPGDGAKTLVAIEAAINGQMEKLEVWKKEIEQRMSSEIRKTDKGKQMMINYLNQKTTFLEDIIEGRNEAFVKLADLNAAITAIPRKRGADRIREATKGKEGDK